MVAAQMAPTFVKHKLRGLTDEMILYEAARDEYRTRGSLLLRLQAGATLERELSWETFYDRYVPLIKGFARRAGAGEEEPLAVCIKGRGHHVARHGLPRTGPLEGRRIRDRCALRREHSVADTQPARVR